MKIIWLAYSLFSYVRRILCYVTKLYAVQQPCSWVPNFHFWAAFYCRCKSWNLPRILLKILTSLFEILVVPVCDFLNRKRQFFNVQLVRYGYQLTVYQNKAGLRIRSKIPEPARKVHLYAYVYNYRYGTFLV